MRTLFHFSSARRDTVSARKGDFVQSQISPGQRPDFTGGSRNAASPDFHVYRSKNARSMKIT